MYVIVYAIISFINSGVVPIVLGYTLLFVIVSCYCFKGKIYINALLFHIVMLLGIAEVFICQSFLQIRGMNLMRGITTYVVAPLVAFLTGYILATVNSKYVEKTGTILFAAIVLGCSVHVLLNLVINFGKVRYELADFFTGEIMAATNMGSENTFIFSLFPCLFLIKDKIWRIVGFMLFSLSFVYSFVLGTRTQLAILLVIILFVVSLRLWENWLNGSVSRRGLFFGIIGIMVILIGILSFAYNVGNIQNIIAGTNLGIRFSQSVTHYSDIARSQMRLAGLKHLYQSPWKGYTGNYKYFHNYWLDVGRVAGIIPVLLLLMQDIILFSHAVIMYRKKKVDRALGLAIICVYLGFFMNFFMEPIMDGYLGYFYRFCLFSGLAEGLYWVVRNRGSVEVKE